MDDRKGQIITLEHFRPPLNQKRVYEFDFF